MTRKLPAFGNRLAYLLWLRHLEDGQCPGNAEIGREVGVTGPAVTGWLKRDDAPDQWKRSVEKKLLEFFGITDRAAWFLEGNGEPPRVDLWVVWSEARQPLAKGGGIDQTRPAGASRRLRGV